jgi:hypothetical protein
MDDVISMAQMIPGCPTFQQFAANPDRYRARADEIFESADKGSVLLKNSIERHIYYFEHYRVEKLEHVERIISDEGLDPRTDVEMKIDLQEGTMNGKYICHVRYTRKSRLWTP